LRIHLAGLLVLAGFFGTQAQSQFGQPFQGGRLGCFEGLFAGTFRLGQIGGDGFRTGLLIQMQGRPQQFGGLEKSNGS